MSETYFNSDSRREIFFLHPCHLIIHLLCLVQVSATLYKKLGLNVFQVDKAQGSKSFRRRKKKHTKKKSGF